MKGYKLTDQDGWTRKGEKNSCQWGENVSHKATGKGKVLCSEDCIHDYKTPIHAVLFNPIGANFKDPILWEGEGKDLKADDGTKRGWGTYTTIKQVPLPDIPLDKKVEFAIRIAKKGYSNPEWNAWADKWLSGEDRSGAAAGATWAARAAWAAGATWATWAAAEAARAASWAARAAGAAAEAAGPQLIDETIREVFGDATLSENRNAI